MLAKGLVSLILSPSFLEKILACCIHWHCHSRPALSLLHGLLFTSMLTPWFNTPKTPSFEDFTKVWKDSSIPSHSCKATVSSSPLFLGIQGKVSQRHRENLSQTWGLQDVCLWRISCSFNFSASMRLCTLCYTLGLQCRCYNWITKIA